MRLVVNNAVDAADHEWITAERLMAYHLLLTIRPETKDAPLAWRAMEITRIVGALRDMHTPEQNTKEKGNALMLLASDAAQMKVEGYKW